jgi:hypothetical protein
MRNRLLAALAVSAFVAVACKKEPFQRMTEMRDELAKGHDAKALMEDVPPCAPEQEPACQNTVATFFGSKDGFNGKTPDQASAATCATFLLRDHRGDLAAPAEPWLSVLRAGSGVGADTLRLAVAARMTEVGPRLAQTWTDDPKLKELLRDVVSAVPGACRTYALVGAGVPDDKLPAEHHWRTSACLFKDLARRDGPGSQYAGDALPRSAHGAIAVYRDVVRALRAGQKTASAPVQEALEKSLPEIERNVELIKLKLPNPEPDRIKQYLGDVHAQAGIELWKADAGAEAGAGDGGVPSDAAAPSDAGSKDAAKK